MRCLRGLAILSMAVCLPACNGGGSGPTPVPTPTPTPAPVTRNIYSAPFTVPAGAAGLVGIGVVDVSVPSAGLVEVLFDYTFATSDIDMVVTTTTCTDPVAAYTGACTTLGSERDPPNASKRSRVAFQVTVASNIRIWIFVFTPDQESGILNVFLTS